MKNNITIKSLILTLSIVLIIPSFISCSDDTMEDGEVGNVQLTKVWNADEKSVNVEGYVVNAGSNVNISIDYGKDKAKLDKKNLVETYMNGDTTFVYCSITNLEKSTKYYIRLSAEKTMLAKVFSSEISEFQTTDAPTPIINNVSCTKYGINDITLNINLVANGTGTCKIMMGESKDKLSEVSPEKGGIKNISGNSSTSFDMTITNLEKGRNYYYQIITENEHGSRLSGIFIARTNYEIVKDINGKEYYATKIGNQLWLTSNWACDKYQDGTPLDSCFVYNDDNANLDSKGRLYTYDVLKANNIAPDGWRLPSENDWKELIDYLGGEYVAGNNMKVESFLGQDETVEFVNRYNFTAIPSGMRNVIGNYYHAEISNTASYAYYWSSTELDNGEAFRVYISKLYKGCYFGSSTTRNAYSVRLVKNIE